MIFTQEQIKEILEIVDYHESFIISNTLGNESLSDYDLFILRKHGIDVDKLISESESTYYRMFLFGRLSGMLSEQQTSQIKYDDFLKYVKRGQYIPLTKQEKHYYELSKNKTYNHIKGLGKKIKNDINSTITEEDSKQRSKYEKAIKEGISTGILDRKSVSSIVSDIGNKTDDWLRDWGRIVETEYNNIFQQGRADSIKRDKGSDALVFKQVYGGACQHCIKHYLTNGIGSQPVVFKLSELEANGSNYGKKTKDWRPVLESMHPFCRCNLQYLPNGYKWNEEKGKFALNKDEISYKRKAKAKVEVGGQTFWR